MQKNQLIDLVSCIYEGVSDPRAFQVVTESLVEYFDCDVGDFVSEDDRNRTLCLYGSVGYDPAYLKMYRTEYCGLDVLSEAARESGVVGPIHSESNFVPKKKFLKSQFFNEWMRPQGELRYGVGASIENNGKWFTNIYMMRSGSRRAFSDADADRMGPIVPHLQRSIRLARRIKGLETNFNTSLLALDRSRLPLVVLDRKGKPLHLSRAAEQLISEDDELMRMVYGRLDSYPGKDVCALRDAIHRATLLAFEDEEIDLTKSECDSFVVIRRTSSSPIGVLVMPVPYREILFDEPVWHVLLVFIDPSQGVGVQEGWLRQLFDFTKTEADFALRFAAGKTVEECAEEMGLSVGTARWHLKNVRAKAGTNRQVGLSVLLNNVLRFS